MTFLSQDDRRNSTSRIWKLYSVDCRNMASTSRERSVYFSKDRMEYLGHKIDSQGIHTSTKKAQAMIDQAVPQNIPQLRSFLGMMNYYGKFIPNLSPMLHPLHALLRASQPWLWSKACDQDFKKAKGHLTQAPILVHYDPDLPIVLASAYGQGAVISLGLP